jgi:hypothetical protein
MTGPVPHDLVAGALENGSPGLLRAVGRAFGLGQADQEAMAQGAVPPWLWLVLGVGAGVAVGVQLQKRAPKYAKYVGGG